MNPLDLSGPDFLAFYALVALVVLFALAQLRQAQESGEVPRVNTGDPYLLAFLREDEAEAVRVAMFSLLDRGLLVFEGKKVKAAGSHAVGLVRRPLERALLSAARKALSPDALVQSTSVLGVARLLAGDLRALGLLPGPAHDAARWVRFSLGALILFGLPVAKMAVALSRGRTNLAFLLILSVLAGIMLLKVCFPRRTVVGERFLADMQGLLAGLRHRRLTPGGATNEAALLAGAYGLGMVPEALFPHRLAIARAGRPGALLTSSGSGSSSGSDASSSSCSSSSCSSSSCGSSCGGGGGCGGCGS